MQFTLSLSFFYLSISLSYPFCLFSILFSCSSPSSASSFPLYLSFLFILVHTCLIDKSHGRTATVSMQLILHTTFYSIFILKKKNSKKNKITIYKNIKRLLSRIIFVEERAYRLRIYDTRTIVLTTI